MNIRQQLRSDLHVSLGSRQPGIDRIITGLAGVEGFILKPGLLIFEGAGSLHFHFHPQEQRHRIGGHLLTGERQQFTEIQGRQGLGWRYRRHPGTPVGVADFHAVGHGFGNMRVLQKKVLDFGGRDVFALPAEGISQPVNKLRVTETDVAQQVTGIEVTVALLEHVVQHNLFGLLRIGVTVQRRLVVNARHQQARFSLGYFLQKADKGEPGLLITEISAKWPFDGYTDPAKSEAVILRNVFKKGDAWFNTGDLMRDIGFKHTQFVDRLGDTFRWKGENVSTTEVENALGAFAGIEDAVVYGVEIPGTNGRCGMAALRLAPGLQLDCAALAVHLDRELPAYAAPLFVRLLREVETTGTFKYKKNDLKMAAYNPLKVTDPLYVRLPGSDRFEVLDGQVYEAIQKGLHRF